MTVSLTVPYKSQFDEDANESRNDCGAACVAMLLNAFGKPVSTNAVFKKTGAAPDSFISTSQLRRAAQGFGVTLEWHTNLTAGHLEAYLNMGRPLIALVHYGTWSERGMTESKFKGPHFVVVVGYDDEHIYIHDPLFTPARRASGANRVIPRGLFFEAWGSAHLDCWGPGQCNPDNGALVATAEFSIKATHVPEDMLRRIQAKAAYDGLSQPDLTHLASLTAWAAALGDWGRTYSVHKVRPEDTLETLAEVYYGDERYAEAIALFNGLAPGDTIYDNGVLWIPEARYPQGRSARRGGGYVPPTVGR